jgi:hypothetical protein
MDQNNNDFLNNFSIGAGINLAIFHLSIFQNSGGTLRGQQGSP